MKEFRLFFGIMTFILFIMCYSYYSRLMPLLLTMVVSLCLMSLALAVAARFFVSVKSVLPPPSETRRGDGFKFSICVKNNFILPLTPVRIYVHTCGKGCGEIQKKMFVTDVAPFREITVDVPNIASFRGKYEVGAVKVDFFDLLKIFKFTLKVDAKKDVISYPRELQFNDLHDDNYYDSGGAFTKPHAFNKDTFAHLREYRDGESLQFIHWKMSAKQIDDGLVAKQMEADNDKFALIFCDLTCRLNTVEDTLTASDTVIEVSQAITREIVLSDNTAVFISNADGGLRNAPIDGGVAYNQLRRELALLPHNPPPLSEKFAELFSENYNEIRQERAVYIVTAAVTHELTEQLKATKLIYKPNAVLTVIQSAANNGELVEYLKNKTQMLVNVV